MGLRQFNALIDNATRKGKNVYRGLTYVYFGEEGKNLDPLKDEGWFDPGKSVSFPKLEKNPEKTLIKAGYPAGSIINLPKEDVRTLSFKFMMPRLFLMELALLGGQAFKINYATTGQTAVVASPAPTKTSCAVTTGDGADFKVNDVVIIDTKHATLGGWESDTVITKVDGDILHFEPLCSVPLTGATVKKVAGRVTGTDKDTVGMKFADSLIPCFERVQVLICTHEVGANRILVNHIPSFEIVKGGFLNFSEDYADLEIEGNPILQENVTVQLRDGTTETRPAYGYYYIVPQEST